ncbi:hypothetical protein ACFWA9_30905 [Kitasatospora sp. NPDC059973]|uniref:hypothetical protein n=1 Tax=Kitasatospora sp. NPDC059973 TaxID=3347020 RepID=UPI0036BB4C44
MSSDHATPSAPADADDQDPNGPEDGEEQNGPGLEPRRLLEFAEFLGMDEEAEQLRGDLRTERILPRLKRALDLAGLPVSPGAGVPGVRVMAERSAGFPAGAVRVAWNEGADLDAMIDTAAPGSPADVMCQVVTSTMDKALDIILQAAGLRTIVDSLHGSVVVADTTTFPEGRELGL